MANPGVSIVIVSHGRPALLRRCLLGVSQLLYRPFEIVVVADAAGLAAIGDLPFAERIKTADQIAANISAARNKGISLSSGDIVAFIDDDAVPEPTWLDRLVEPVSTLAADAVGGHVIGRNGISLQWGSRVIDPLGWDREIDLGTGEACLPDIPEGHALKLEGTNFAVRRRCLIEAGGFDEAFAFYLDDTDLALRLARQGHRMAAAPKALVHHGYASSPRRASSRAPRSLYDIGASRAVFLNKHVDPTLHAAQLDRLRKGQRRRLSAFLLRGDLERRDLRRLLRGLDAGIEEGRDRTIGQAASLSQAEPPDFLPALGAPPRPPGLVAGRWFQRRRILDAARHMAAEGRSATAIILSPTILAHRMRFLDEGIWLQSGGLFGRSDRSQPRVQLWRLADRVAAETQRIAEMRGLDDGSQ